MPRYLPVILRDALTLVLLLSAPAAPSRAQDGRVENAGTQQRVGAIDLRLLDIEGRPLAPGTMVRASVTWGPLRKEHERAEFIMNFGVIEDPHALHVAEEGRFRFPGIASWYDHASTHHGTLVVFAPELAGKRARGTCAWPVDPAAARPLVLRLQAEVELCRGRLVDSLGARVAYDTVEILVQTPGSSFTQRVGFAGDGRDGLRRAKLAEGELALLGWPVEGVWRISASYFNHGPASAPRDFTSAEHDVELVLPATGIVQLQAKLPRPFPRDALHAVYRHATTGEEVRKSFSGDAINHRLIVGAHALELELAGERLLDLGTIDVPHGCALDVPVELPSALRAFHLFVKDESGKELPRAKARLESARGEHAFRRDGPPWGVLIATTQPRVDLVVECDGFETLRLTGVEGERKVRLRRAEH
jgi:hypothetical protein